MTCNNCGREVGQGDNFCSSCGVNLVPEGPSEQGPAPEGDASGPVGVTTDTPDVAARLQALQATVAAMQADVTRNSERLLLVERALSIDVRDTASGAGDTVPVAASLSSAAPESVQSPAAGQPVPQSAPYAPSPPGAPPRGGVPFSERLGMGLPNWDWEWLFGGNWLARIGVVALVIGIGFFLKLAFDNQWIGETGRVVLGLVAGWHCWGPASTGAGSTRSGRNPSRAGGLAILYLAIFAAFSPLRSHPASLALGLFFLVTVTAAGLALRYESFAIAVLGILGGFATPLFLAEQLPDSGSCWPTSWCWTLVCWRWRPSATGGGSPFSDWSDRWSSTSSGALNSTPDCSWPQWASP